MNQDNAQPETYRFADDGIFPNSGLPLVVYRKTLAGGGVATRDLFKRHNWLKAWTGGIYNFHHYHSTAHEVLGVVAGHAQVIIGGPSGLALTLEKGDVLIIPAGVAHKCTKASDDFNVVGAYPDGQDWDVWRGTEREAARAIALENIARVPLPVTDPVFGLSGCLPALWHKN